MSTPNIPNNPPNFDAYKRDEHGLLSNVGYIYNTDSSVNWRAMIDPRFLVIQRGKEAKVAEIFGKELQEIDLRLVDDKYLMILLGGIKELARIRGIKSCSHKVDASTPDNATVTCTIEFIGNYETNGQSISFSDVGTATLDNTAGFGKLYLASIASNRAFVRAVRNFLNINIVGQDEVKAGENLDDISTNTSDKPWGRLAALAAEKNITFEDIKKGALTKYRSEIDGSPEKWSDFKDIQPTDIWVLLGKLNKKP